MTINDKFNFYPTARRAKFLVPIIQAGADLNILHAVNELEIHYNVFEK